MKHEDFWSHVLVKSPKECWPWLGTNNGNGYGRVLIGGLRNYAHRIAYESRVGPIPPGMIIDHLCRNRICVNPAHLEVVTHRENLIRGDHFTNNYSRLKTYCKHGHEFTPENTYIIPSTGSRHCRTCRREWHKAAYAKEKARR